MLPSPFLSILLKTSSACARLVPPAPSAFSNSDLLIWPSPLASSCENRSCSALDGLVDAGVVVAGVVVAVGDWLCAASSVLMVAGDIWVKPLPPVVGVEVPEVGVVLPDRSNGLLEFWLKPVAGGDFAFGAVSDCRASSADDTAPRASSMAELRQMPQCCGL